jgi:hypothetical protein
MHVGQPPIAKPLSTTIEQAAKSLKVIEDLREPYVRGSEPIQEGAEKDWVRAYQECVKQLLDVLGPSGAPQ